MSKKIESIDLGNKETSTEYAARKLEEYCYRLKDDIKEVLDASVQPLEGSLADRQQAFVAHLGELAQQDKRSGPRWMSLSDTYSNVRRYGKDVIVAAAVSRIVEWGIM